MTDTLAERLFLNGGSPVGLYPKPPRTYEAGGHGVFGGRRGLFSTGFCENPFLVSSSGLGPVGYKYSGYPELKYLSFFMGGDSIS